MPAQGPGWREWARQGLITSRTNPCLGGITTRASPGAMTCEMRLFAGCRWTPCLMPICRRFGTGWGFRLRNSKSHFASFARRHRKKTSRSLVPEERPLSVPDGRPEGFSHFSSPGLARWCCLHALTSLSGGSVERSRDVYDRIRLLPLDRLDIEDRYRFLAWVLMRTDLTETSFADPLARWLVDQGAADDDRLKNWSTPISERVGQDAVVQRPGLLEFISLLRQEVRRTKQERREKPHGSSRSRSDTSL